MITGETTNAFDNNYEDYINESTFRSHSKYQNLWESQNVEAIADPSGVDLNGIVTNIDTDKIIEAYLVRSGNGSENVSDYTLIPYVIKHEKYVNNNSTGGWHIDCQVVKKESVKNISDFTKSVVTSAEQLPAGIENTGYTFPKTVTGAKDAKFTITDESATLVSGSLTGTIPEAGNVDVYVSRTFSANDIKNGYLVNTATIAPNDDNLTKVDDGKSEATAKTPATKPETPAQTDTVNAKYFVLMPSKGTPTSGKDQGVKNYFPNKSDKGGVQYGSNLTGYRGNISASIIEKHPEANTKDGYFVANGVDSKYLVVPSDLGYFSGGYNGTFPSALGDNFSMQGKRIIWYVVKNEGTQVLPDYHVDGYLAGIPVELRYHENFDFSGTDDTIGKVNKNGEKDLFSGDTVTISGISETITAQHPGWTFVGWTENRDGSGILYKAGNPKVMMDSCDLYAKWKKNDYDYTVKFYKDAVSAATHISGADQTKKAAFGMALNDLSVDTTIAGNKCPDGYNTQGKIDENTSLTKIEITGNVVNVVLSKRTDLSYTVNYLEKGTNKVLHTPKTESNKTFEDTITAANEVITIDGYNYDSVDKDTLTIGTGNNVINLYYVKRNDLSYTVNYLEKGTNKVLHAPKTESDKTFENTITAVNEKIDIAGYKYDSVSPETLTIGTDVSQNVINVYYTELAKYNIVIHYVDDAGTPLKGDESITGQYDGSPYDVTNKIHDRINNDYVKESMNGSATGTVNGGDVTIIVVYTKDVLVDSTVVPKPDGPGDNIPDKYQVTINYVSSDTTIGRITGRTQEVLTIYVDKKPASNGTVQANGSTAEATGSRNYFSNWTKEKKDGTQVGANTTLEPLEIKDAEGGKTYTFYANFYHRSSSGGGGGSRPTVTIPDDVPTGLNGKDHYAYIIGYGNNDVRPQNNITRAEVATIFFRLLTDETREANMTKSNGYNDVKDGDWFCYAVSTLSKMGIIKGYEDGSFKPNDPISRAEFAAIAARFDPDGDKTPATFADVTSHWAKDEISIAANHGWIKGYEDGSFKPDQKITRAETMTLVNRVLNRLPETKDDLHKDMKTWVDNMDETAWYYLAVQEATNSHYFKNKTSTKFEQWTDLRDTRDWSELEK